MIILVGSALMFGCECKLGDVVTELFQVTVREADQGWIFGEYICRARNNYGTGEQIITLNRASKRHTCSIQFSVMYDHLSTMNLWCSESCMQQWAHCRSQR